MKKNANSTPTDKPAVFLALRVFLGFFGALGQYPAMLTHRRFLHDKTKIDYGAHELDKCFACKCRGVPMAMLHEKVRQRVQDGVMKAISVRHDPELDNF